MAPEKKEYMRKWREANRGRIRIVQKRWNDSHRDHINARNKKWEMNNKDKVALKAKRWASENKERKRLKNHLLHKSYKEQVVKGYGGSCTCCGETEIRFLTLEHINHDGKQHRSSVGVVYLDVIRRGFPKDEFTVLCMNCNFATRYGHKCPHQKTILELVA